MMTIERMKMSDIDEAMNDSRIQLASQAKAVLGYGKLARVLAVGSLTQTLRKLGIEPLVRSKVESYKNKKARTGMWSSHKQGIAFLMVALSVLLPTLTFNMKVSWAIPNGGQLTVLAGMASSIVFFVAGCIYLVTQGEGVRKIFSWEVSSINTYQGNIPEFALDKAVQIKTECPNAELFVEQLYAREGRYERPRPMPDPFLRVDLGTESYYIDVWDEKEYEKSL